MTKPKIDRRSFLKNTALTAASASALPWLNIATAETPSVNGGRKLNCVQIGCGARAMQHLEAVVGEHGQNLIAIVDPDPNQLAKTLAWLKNHAPGSPQPKQFADYRRMFDEIGKNVDAVFIATPNHQHAIPALMAMERGINVYCEKPLCHDIAEARRLRETAAKHPKVATQTGTQGHCEDGYRSLYEYVQAGVIGNITETHSWTDRSNGGEGPRPASVKFPPGMDWDLWIGPAPFRNYHPELHPHNWHGWHDFGNGSIGNMACHVLDGVFWALKIGHPTSVEVEYMRGGSEERYPTGCRLRWDVPARGEMPALKSYWYEGLNPTTTKHPSGPIQSVSGEARNLPSLVKELWAKYPDEEFDSNGTLYVGDRGILYTGTYGDRMRLVPMEKMRSTLRPPKTLPRPKDVFSDFISACQEGRTDTAAPFEYGARLTEFALIGNLAQIAGPHKKLDWDGPNMKVNNLTEMNAWVKRPSRAGWGEA